MTRKLAQALRREMTSLERPAWDLLKQLRSEDIHVRRQHPVGRYVADFAIMRSRLAIEIDGPLHEQEHQRQRDLERDRYFADAGWPVFRFTPKQLDNELTFLATIRVSPRPLPPPLAGRGSDQAFAPEFQRRTRANRKLKPRRKP